MLAGLVDVGAHEAEARARRRRASKNRRPSRHADGQWPCRHGRQFAARVRARVPASPSLRWIQWTAPRSMSWVDTERMRPQNRSGASSVHLWDASSAAAQVVESLPAPLWRASRLRDAAHALRRLLDSLYGSECEGGKGEHSWILTWCSFTPCVKSVARNKVPARSQREGYLVYGSSKCGRSRNKGLGDQSFQ